MMAYLTKGQNMDITSCCCQHFTGEVHAKDDKDGTVSFISNWGTMLCKTISMKGGVCAFQFGLKRGSLIVTVDTI
jgi:hypothetical protein